MKNLKYCLAFISVLVFSEILNAQIKKDSLLPRNVFGVGLYIGMLPRIIDNSLVVSQPVNAAYGFSISYSHALKKDKPLYIDVTLDTERGRQKYTNVYRSSSSAQRVNVINYLTYINAGVGLKHLFALKKQQFLSLYIGATLSYLTITKQKQNDITSHGMRPLSKLNFAVPFNPECSYMKFKNKIGYKVTGGVNFFTQDGPLFVYSRVLPYVTLGLVIR